MCLRCKAQWVSEPVSSLLNDENPNDGSQVRDCDSLFCAQIG